MQIHKFLMRLSARFGLLIRNNSKYRSCYISKVSLICYIRINKHLMVGHVQINSICKSLSVYLKDQDSIQVFRQETLKILFELYLDFQHVNLHD